MGIFTIHGFDSPVWLLIGTLLMSAFLYYAYFKKGEDNFLHQDLLLQVYKKNSLWYQLYIFLIVSISLLFFIILAGPYKNDSIEKISKNGIDIEIVFDVSYSMIATDIFPSRIDVARRVFSNFVSGLESDRVGLILFSGKPFQSIPLSYDYAFLSDFISQVSVETIDQRVSDLQGTAIGDAVILASDVLGKDAPEREKIIILITDGEANRGIEPNLALKLLKEKEIKTYTIGVGKDEQSSVRVPAGNGFSREVRISGVDEEILKKISQETGGKYFKAENERSFREILLEIEKLEKSELEFESIQYHFSQRIVFLLLLFPCFLGLCVIVFLKKIQL